MNESEREEKIEEYGRGFDCCRPGKVPGKPGIQARTGRVEIHEIILQLPSRSTLLTAKKLGGLMRQLRTRTPKMPPDFQTDSENNLSSTKNIARSSL
jgi:hypothetical protein